MAFANGSFNIAIDLTLFVLPVTQFINVSWTKRKKFGVSLIFLVGLFVTVSSCIRLASLTRFAGTHNPTFDFKNLSIWSLVEMHLSVICACMPGMTAFIRRIKPRMPCCNAEVPEEIRNKPRTGHGVMRRIRETFTRITEAARGSGNGSAWNRSKKTTTSTMTGTQLSTFDREAPEYRDYLAYASYIDNGTKATQTGSPRSEREQGGGSVVREISHSTP
ncbi:CFEM domain-containing protein [Colletotrichum karsti]|uniref:CFEM domain-containing protein n=1 Tax=Colletotrichum karsti TaxID=1095194 RepID=A0A9P6ICW5_9PEZI|nr:CFEM domain-containing protein [Colletotrichum karsti]KAF9880504.1 CFEM domain-containing protein [Colletotrichum karsti]